MEDLVNLPEGKELFRIDEVAKLFGVSRPTVYDLINNGDLVAVNVCTGLKHKRVTRRSLLAFLERRKVTPAI